MAEAAHLAVARFLKPHGLKGEGLVVALTDDPAGVFVPGRRLVPLNEDGAPTGDEVTVARARHFHGKQWLLGFTGISGRPALESWRDRLLGAAASDLTPLAEGQMYEHEITGCSVVAGGVQVGIAQGLIEVPQGTLLVVEGRKEGKEYLIPFRRPIITRLDRQARRIEIEPPAGLLDL